MQKFENMDVIAALEAIMHQNTAYYQSDFAFDIKMLREAARSDQPEDKLLLWLSRPSGTFCFRERDVLLKDITGKEFKKAILAALIDVPIVPSMPQLKME